MRSALSMVVLAAVVATTAACGGSDLPSRTPDVSGVVDREAGSERVTLSGPSNPYYDGMDLLRGSPVIVARSDESALAPEDLAGGDVVDVWIEGACAESSPVQCTVTALRVRD
ncbi:hypothetical protein J4G33_09460 [Actinotalea sp. BY-33]|uniref:DUF5666 domain-containing protein n=1 Tax=Actinotalea soli TaxID=2819234 RepID=A0A939LQM9_9CELL|nr:hypothetical protein [Actinotalea soli]MBO1752028.1 hypothetical protein [Actinotalea soli]